MAAPGWKRRREGGPLPALLSRQRGRPLHPLTGQQRPSPRSGVKPNSRLARLRGLHDLKQDGGWPRRAGPAQLLRAVPRPDHVRLGPRGQNLEAVPLFRGDPGAVRRDAGAPAGVEPRPEGLQPPGSGHLRVLGPDGVRRRGAAHRLRRGRGEDGPHLGHRLPPPFEARRAVRGGVGGGRGRPGERAGGQKPLPPPPPAPSPPLPRRPGGGGVLLARRAAARKRARPAAAGA